MLSVIQKSYLFAHLHRKKEYAIVHYQTDERKHEEAKNRCLPIELLKVFLPYPSEKVTVLHLIQDKS